MSILQVVGGPNNMAQDAAGQLALPIKFDSKRYAARWEKEGPRVDALKEPQRLAGLNLQAEGWQVWKHPDTKEPYRVALQTGAYILLFRSKEVQEAVNAEFGKLSRTRSRRERSGETIATAAKTPGMLSNADLPPEPGMSDSEEDEAPIKAHFDGEETTTTEGNIARRGRRLNS